MMPRWLMMPMPLINATTEGEVMPLFPPRCAKDADDDAVTPITPSRLIRYDAIRKMRHIDNAAADDDYADLSRLPIDAVFHDLPGLMTTDDLPRLSTRLPLITLSIIRGIF